MRISIVYHIAIRCARVEKRSSNFADNFEKESVKFHENWGFSE